MQQIEPLEHRQLLSAVVYGAAKTSTPKPTIPNIAFGYTGTGTETKPIHAIGQLRLNIQTESAKGALSGTFTNVTAGKTGNFTGTVNKQDVITIKVVDSLTGKVNFTFKGKYSAATHAITGTYKGAATKTVKKSSGTFSLAVISA